MIRAGIIGLGKMGLSHYAIFNAHSDVDVVAIAEPSQVVRFGFEKLSNVSCFKDYEKMIDEASLDCVVVAAPTRTHKAIVQYALEKNLHVFCEKPFCLNPKDGNELSQLAKTKGLVNQVGYHCRFTGVFQKAKELLTRGVIGDVYHFTMEVYGNVVSKKEGMTWRTKKSEGGGCLYDYASHGIDLVNYLIGVPDEVQGTVLRRIFSQATEDAVYSTFLYRNGVTGHLATNWCDATFRKMFNQITIMGTNGKIIADRQECKVFVKDNRDDGDLEKGWNTFYTTDVTKPVKYYLRGEEYSAQVEHFIENIKSGRRDSISSFEDALQTDIIIERMMLAPRDERGNRVSLLHCLRRCFSTSAMTAKREKPDG